MTKPIQVKNVSFGEGLPKICVPLTGITEDEIKKEGKKAVEAGAELVEWRADFFEALDDRESLEKTLLSLSDILGQVPLLFTIRTSKEGGNREIRIKDYVNCNMWACETGKADFIDVEAFGDEEEKKALIQSLQEKGTKVIASYHDFQKTESKEELKDRFRVLYNAGGDILKIAEMPAEFENTADLMLACREMTEEIRNPLVAISMGNTGSISRISGENFGSCITFATVGKASAPGQFPVKELRMMMEALHEKNKE